MNKDFVFRPKGNLAWAIVALVLDALYLIQSVFYNSGASNVLFDLIFGITAGSLVYVLWVRPKLVLKDTYLRVVNPLSSKKISYENISSLETKWGLLIRHSDLSTRVWVAPANGKFRWATNTKIGWNSQALGLTKGIATTETQSSSQSLDSDSGIAARLIRDRAKHLH